MPLETLDPAFEEAIRSSFSRQRLMATLGARLVLVAQGEVHVEVAVAPHITQQAGVVHAGALASIADSACGGAALTLMPPGSDVVSVEFKLNLLAPAAGERVIAKGRVIRAGRTITACGADVFAVRGGEETLVATMLGTMMRR